MGIEQLYYDLRFISNFIKSLNFLRKEIKTYQPSVLHFQSFTDSLFAIRYQNSIQTVHDIHTITRKILRMPPSLKLHFILKISKFQKFVVAPSHLIRRGLYLFKFPKEKIVVINHGVDTSFFYPRNVERTENSVMMVNPTLKKGWNILLKELPFLIKKIPRIKFYLVNNPDTPIPEKYRKFFKIVQFPNSETLAKIYSSSQIFILPSLYEPFGLTALEAMACGAIPIVSDRCGCCDVIKNGKNGFCLPLKSFFKKIPEILEKYDLEKISKRCVKYAKILDWKFVAQKYLQVYNKIIEENYFLNCI